MRGELRLEFPAPRGHVVGSWAPIYVEPIPASGERLTIGVIAKCGVDYAVLEAPGLDRLYCLYDTAAGAVIYAAKTSLLALEDHLARNGIERIDSFRAPFVSVSLGKERSGRGDTLKEIASLGLRSSSSLITARSKGELSLSVPQEFRESLIEGLGETALLREVKEVVVQRRPALRDAFSRPFRSIQGGRATRIGFLGHTLVANFGVLRPAKLSYSIKEVKTGLWDLSSHRDIDTMFPKSDYEMLIHRPAEGHPDLTERQVTNLAEACAELEYEADKKEIRVRPMTSAKNIGLHILNKEAHATNS